MKLGNVGFIWSKTNERWELIQYLYPTDSLCENHVVISSFKRGSEGYDMRTVGDRFFEAGPDAFEVGKLAMSFLDVLFQREEAE